jgi:predicted enzyme related to lactoylglutathione lyase
MFRTTTNDKGEENGYGAIAKRQRPNEPIINYMGINSVTDYSEKVKEHGGKVIIPKTEVPNFGWFAICTDTENNTFALCEEKPPQK